MAIIAPSVLASDWGRLNEEIKAVTAAGADSLHLDVMDGKFVPPITFGPQLVKAVRKLTGVPLDVHLMIVEPENQIESFVKAGANSITVHQETCPNLHRTVQQIHELGAKAGVAINPGTAVASLAAILEDIDLVLVMTVNPGWGGQEFIKSCLAKIKETAKMISQSGKTIHLQVDGGINPETAKLCQQAGADVFVAGTYIFGQKDYAGAIAALRTATQTARK